MRWVSKLLLALVLVVPSVTMADDLFPPPWRGQPGTTWGEWDFLTPNPNPLPDMGFNPYGSPMTEVYPGVGQVYWPALNGRTGVWPLSGEMYFTIPNQPTPNPWKDIYIQLTWQAQAPGNTPFVMTVLPGVVSGAIVQQIPLGGGWMHTIYTIRLYPNPTSEKILITGGIDVDQVVIDTWCVPEPATLAVLGLGGFALLRRRRA